MIKIYSAICGNLKVEFQAPTPRESLDAAMKFAKYNVARGRDVTVFCGKDIVWTSQKPLTSAVA